MSQFFMIGLLIFFAGLVVVVFGMKMEGKLRRYEFNNRTSGGTVEFPSYEASRSHEMKRRVAKLIITLGGFPLFIGGFISLLALVNR